MGGRKENDVDKLLRQCEVCAAVTLSRMAVYKLRKAGDFPEPITLGKTALRWYESEIVAWLASKR